MCTARHAAPRRNRSPTKPTLTFPQGLFLGFAAGSGASDHRRDSLAAADVDSAHFPTAQCTVRACGVLKSPQSASYPVSVSKGNRVKRPVRNSKKSQVSAMAGEALALLLLFVPVPAVHAAGGICAETSGAAADVVAGAVLPDGLCVSVLASTEGQVWRGLRTTADGDVVAVDKSGGKVWRFRDPNRDGTADDSGVIATAPGLNHGVLLAGGFLYASSDTTVYRFRDVPGSLDDQSSTRQTVIHSMPAGGHTTRTLEVDREGRLLVSVVASPQYPAKIPRALRQVGASCSPLTLAPTTGRLRRQR